MSEYATQGSRKKLKKAYSSASPLVSAIYETSDKHILIINSEDKAILIRPTLIPVKTTRTSMGTTIFAMNLKKNQVLAEVVENYEKRFPEAYQRYRKTKIPAKVKEEKPAEKPAEVKEKTPAAYPRPFAQISKKPL